MLPEGYLRKGENELTVGVKQLRDGAVPHLKNVDIDVRYIDVVRPPTLPAPFRSVPVHDMRLPVGLSIGSQAVAFRIDHTEVDESMLHRNDLKLKLKINNYTYYDEFDVLLNGHLLPAKSRKARAIFIMNNDSLVTYPVNKGQLVPGDNELVVQVRKLNPAITVSPKLVGLQITGQ